MSIVMNDVPKRTTHIWSKKGEYIYAVSLSSGRESILNHLFSKVWELIDGEKTVQKIYDRIQDAPIEKEQLLKILSDLSQLNLISTKNYLWENGKI